MILNLSAPVLFKQKWFLDTLLIQMYIFLCFHHLVALSLLISVKYISTTDLLIIYTCGIPDHVASICADYVLCTMNKSFVTTVIPFFILYSLCCPSCRRY